MKLIVLEPAAEPPLVRGLLRRLQGAGFSSADISVLFPDRSGTKD